MKRLIPIIFACLLVAACSGKEKLSAPMTNEFPSSTSALPAAITGKWTRTSSFRTFDYKPDEWVVETGDLARRKYLQLNGDKSYSSNQLLCVDCKIEWLRDTLYVKHSKGFYKFPVLLLNDSVLHLKTKIDQPAYSLPNTGLFDFVLEERYSKVK